MIAIELNAPSAVASAFLVAHQREATRLTEEKQSLRAKRRKIKALLDGLPHVAESDLETVHLNVGGTRFTAAASTLRNSEWFEHLLSGRFDVKREHDGCFIIDRDGQHFAHILNYLRMGETGLMGVGGLSPWGKLQLALEADFYHMANLKAWVKTSMVAVIARPEASSLMQRLDQARSLSD